MHRKQDTPLDRIVKGKGVRTTIRWSNGMVTTFDHLGSQMPELQGRFEEVADKVRQAANEGTKFQLGHWPHAGRRYLKEASIREWFDESWSLDGERHDGS